MSVKQKFEQARLAPSTHLGLGDIRVSIGWQEEIVAEIEMLREALRPIAERGEISAKVIANAKAALAGKEPRD